MKFTRLIAALLLAGIALAARAATPLVNLVDENSSFVVIAHDVPALLKTYKDGPWLKAWDDEQLKKFLAPLRAKLQADDWNDKVKSETGFTIEEIQAFFAGDILFAIGDMSKVDFSTNNPDDFPAILAADIGKNKTNVEKLFSSFAKEKKSTTETETYAGVVINIVTTANENRKPDVNVWAIADSTLLVAPSKQSIIAAIDALKNGGVDNAFGKSTRYLQMQQLAHNPQLLYAVNMRALYPLINAGIAARAKSGKQDAAMLDYANLASTLGLDALGDIFAGVTYADDHVDVSGAFTYSEKRGLLKLLAIPEGSVELPAFASASWPGVSVMNYSIPDAFAALEEIFAAISPGLSAMAQSQLQQFKQNAGIDIKRDLIGSIGTQITTANILAAGATIDDTNLIEKIGTLYAIELKDARTFTGTLETLKRFAGLENSPVLTTREYLGATIGTFQNRAAPQNQFSYAIVKNQLLISVGSPTVLEAAVQNIVNGAPDPIKNRADVRAAFADAPASTVSYSVQDTAFTFRFVCDLFGTLPQMREFVDPAAVPDSAFFKKYLGNAYGWTTSEPGGFYFTSKIFYKK